MKKKDNLIVRLMEEIPARTAAHHIGAYAAQAAYFFMLCMIPIILLLLTMVQYTPVTKADVMTAVIQVFPSSVNTMITSIVNQVYNQSSGIIPITLIVTLWSAGKGVLSITTGFNCINDCHETRNYIFLRIRATFYTFLFILVIAFLLVLSVFGNTLNIFIMKYIPIARTVSDSVMEARTVLMPVILVVFLCIVYTTLPNKKIKFTGQVLGAIFGTIGCIFMSWLFSMYLYVFTGFSTMYGSLTTIVLVMLWMYFCMYCILLGSEINRWLEVRNRDNQMNAERVSREAEMIPEVEMILVEDIVEQRIEEEKTP